MKLTFATQGGELSYHALAAKKICGGIDVDVDEKRKFGEVVVASRSTFPGLGVIAIKTVAGTVEDSATELVKKRPSALPPVVGRVDLPIMLSLIGSEDMTPAELAAPGVRCLAQKPAHLQCKEFLDEHAPYIKVRYIGESVEGVREALSKKPTRNGKQHPYVAIGPHHVAEPLGGKIIGPEQINPIGSVTSFYALQRDPREHIIPKDPRKTERVTVISLAHPEGEGEIDKCVKIIIDMGVRIARFIPFNIGDFTKHDKNTRRGGGILELAHDLYDEVVPEWCARINGIAANDTVRGPFNTIRLGGYDWYPQPDLDPEMILELSKND
jgi:prephenate dehydratase